MGSESIRIRIRLPRDVERIAETGDTQNAAGLLAAKLNMPFRAAVECILEWRICEADAAASPIPAANENEPAPA